MTNNDAEGDIEYWRKQLSVANDFLQNRDIVLSAKRITLENSRLTFCKRKIDELGGKK